MRFRWIQTNLMTRSRNGHHQGCPCSLRTQSKSYSIFFAHLSIIFYVLGTSILTLSSTIASDPLEVSQYCPTGRSAATEYTVYPSKDLFREVSYLQFSDQTTQDGHPLAWIGSDGAQSTIQAVDLHTGEIYRKFTLSLPDSASNSDWEAIGGGPCTAEINGPRCLYFGNVGNNNAQKCKNQYCSSGRSVVELYKLYEPDFSQYSGEEDVVLPVAIMLLDYDHIDMPVNRADCESIFVDPVGDDQGGQPGDLYLVTKSPMHADLQRLVKVPDEHKQMKPGDTMKFTLIPMGQPYDPTGASIWTGADMSENGSLIALTDGYVVHFFPRAPHMTVSQAISNPACEFVSPTERGGVASQYEAVAFRKGAVADVSECKNQRKCTLTVFEYDLLFPTATSITASPSSFPTYRFSTMPSTSPSVRSTPKPSGNPTAKPSLIHSSDPSSTPSSSQSQEPSSKKTEYEIFSITTTESSLTPSSTIASRKPSTIPQTTLVENHSDQPSITPSAQPLAIPTGSPSAASVLFHSFAPNVVGFKSLHVRNRPSTETTIFAKDYGSIPPTSDNFKSLHVSNRPSTETTIFAKDYGSIHPTSDTKIHVNKYPSSTPALDAPTSSSNLMSNFSWTIDNHLDMTGQETYYPSPQPSMQPTALQTLSLDKNLSNYFYSDQNSSSALFDLFTFGQKRYYSMQSESPTTSSVFRSPSTAPSDRPSKDSSQSLDTFQQQEKVRTSFSLNLDLALSINSDSESVQLSKQEASTLIRVLESHLSKSYTMNFHLNEDEFEVRLDEISSQKDQSSNRNRRLTIVTIYISVTGEFTTKVDTISEESLSDATTTAFARTSQPLLVLTLNNELSKEPSLLNDLELEAVHVQRLSNVESLQASSLNPITLGFSLLALASLGLFSSTTAIYICHFRKNKKLRMIKDHKWENDINTKNGKYEI